MLPESSLSQCRQCPSCTSRSRGPKPPWKPPAWAETRETWARQQLAAPRSLDLLLACLTAGSKPRCRVGLSSPPMSPMLWGPGAMALATLVPSSAGVCGATCRLGLGRVMVWETSRQSPGRRRSASGHERDPASAGAARLGKPLLIESWSLEASRFRFGAEADLV